MSPSSPPGRGGGPDPPPLLPLRQRTERSAANASWAGSCLATSDTESNPHALRRTRGGKSHRRRRRRCPHLCPCVGVPSEPAISVAKGRARAARRASGGVVARAS
eukprot:7391484-Prymnesium_polylepis.5